MVNILVFIDFRRPRIEHLIKTDSITFQTADPEICPILIFYEKVWD